MIIHMFRLNVSQWGLLNRLSGETVSWACRTRKDGTTMGLFEKIPGNGTLQTRFHSIKDAAYCNTSARFQDFHQVRFCLGMLHFCAK